ncbi:MAG: threonine synthase [Caulobacteraceae bacterium]
MSGYISTRGGAPEVGFVDALLAGLAPDGGLYCPAAWPIVRPDAIAGFRGRPYGEVAASVLGRFAGEEIDAADLGRMCAEAYGAFSHPAVTPLRQIAPGRFVLELFHGPTLAFKDVAMQILARLFEHVLAARGRRMTIVCATSGDTGGAAVEAFRGRANVRIVALFPEGRISEVQRRFMTTAGDDNVACVAVAGDFDDCQAILKDLFADRAFAHEVDLAAVNSIAFARVAAQCVYYFVAAAALGAPRRPVAFAVPTGNFGDAFAGYAAHRMGLPIESILVATNVNDIVARALATGRYERRPAAATMSPAMDIQVASNFERLWFECAGRAGAPTAAAFQAFAAAGAADIPRDVLVPMRAVFRGAAVSEAETSEAMAKTWRETGTLVDPHTAVAMAAGEREGAGGEPPMVILSTAHPAKFPEAVFAATGETPPVPPVVRAMAGMAERIDRLPATAGAVKAYVRRFAAR